jgi:hypothetical protein
MQISSTHKYAPSAYPSKARAFLVSVPLTPNKKFTSVAEVQPKTTSHPRASPAQTSAVFYFGTVTALLFMGFNVAQSFITTLHASLGFVILAVMYVRTLVVVYCVIYSHGQSSFAVGSFVAPEVVELCGARVGVIAGSCTFVLAVAAIDTDSTAFLLISVVIQGFGMGVYWISWGSWMALLCAHSGTMGELNGIFWGVFGLWAIVGNVAVIIALEVSSFAATGI